MLQYIGCIHTLDRSSSLSKQISLYLCTFVEQIESYQEFRKSTIEVAQSHYNGRNYPLHTSAPTLALMIPFITFTSLSPEILTILSFVRTRSGHLH